MKKSAIILAGGKGSRFGYVDKAFLKWKERYFIDILIEKLRVFHEIVIVTNSPEKYKNYKDVKIVEDIVKGVGPLGGIYTGLKNISTEETFVISCDTPFICEFFINYLNTLNSNDEIVIPIVQDKKQPLCALYNKSVINIIENALANREYKISNIFNKTSTKYIYVENEIIIKSFSNINTKEDLEEMWSFSI